MEVGTRRSGAASRDLRGDGERSAARSSGSVSGAGCGVRSRVAADRRWSSVAVGPRIRSAVRSAIRSGARPSTRLRARCSRATSRCPGHGLRKCSAELAADQPRSRRRRTDRSHRRPALEDLIASFGPARNSSVEDTLITARPSAGPASSTTSAPSGPRPRIPPRPGARFPATPSAPLSRVGGAGSRPRGGGLAPVGDAYEAAATVAAAVAAGRFAVRRCRRSPRWESCRPPSCRSG